LAGENAKLRLELAELGGTVEGEIPAHANALLKDNKRLQKAISDARQSQGAQTSDDDIKEIGGTKFIGKVLEGFPPQDLKPMADALKAQIGSGVVALVATNDGKASIVVGVTDDLTASINAVDLVRIGSAALGGKGGGGRPDMAQAGGPNAAAANDGVTAIEGALAG
jgi:alanyl-tRNA synthetase